MDKDGLKELKSRTRDKSLLEVITYAESLQGELRTERDFTDEQGKAIKKLEKVVKRLSGNQKVPPCPCLNPDDHAGWCPRRERDA